jgi:hypothetical protein
MREQVVADLRDAEGLLSCAGEEVRETDRGRVGALEGARWLSQQLQERINKRAKQRGGARARNRGIGHLGESSGTDGAHESWEARQERVTVLQSDLTLLHFGRRYGSLMGFHGLRKRNQKCSQKGEYRLKLRGHKVLMSA